MVTRATFHADLESLQRDLLRMGALVAETIQKAVQSLVQHDKTVAQAVIDGDDVVDDMLIDIEKRSLQLLALQQPMAKDLRTIGTALKAATDLERMADHATDIAKVTLQLTGESIYEDVVLIPRMADQAEAMIHEALAALVARDVARARRMIDTDDEMDFFYAQAFDELMAMMQQRPQIVRQASLLLLVALDLERIGDHATNLGEWTIYMVTGEIENLNG